MPNSEMKDRLKKSFKYHLKFSLAKHPEKIDVFDSYKAMALSIRNLLVEKWVDTADYYEEKLPKSVYYLSLEYLMGRTLGNAMINLEIFEDARDAMEEMGYNLDEVREKEVDAGLGNGGLGRLAACFLDSMATLDLPSMGYGIRYDYGIFKQKIQNGYQVEEPDNWLRNGNPWEIPRPERAKVIHFYGYTDEPKKDSCPTHRDWKETEDVLAMPFDIPIPGYKTDTVNTLRLWSAKSLCEFNLKSFNKGDYLNANIDATLVENISKILYPNDNNYEGKELRLKQQYFLVSASLQDIIERVKRDVGNNMKVLPEKIAVQLNDTHPALAVPELMRILIDEENLLWNEAWQICNKVFNYTNHTLMSEALEKWSVELLKKLLPRILEIIYEINSIHLRKLANLYPGDFDKLSRMSLIEEGENKMVRMAYMAVIASSKVNGVAALHTKLLKNGLFKDFSEIEPEKFVNVTNGITPRRWLKKANPLLSNLVSESIGNEWVKNLDKIRDFEKFAEDKSILKRLAALKRKNKSNLSDYINETLGLKVNPDSMFDVQVKRLHEYKRQLMNVLHAIALYLDIKDNPDKDFVPRTVIFSAKAAPGYQMAKMIIKLINSVAYVINSDKQLKDKLKVLFLPNYRVSLAEKIIPAADLSEQISLAGTEASGTGNMKFALNGALTIGTMDGANVEIYDAVGEDNIYIFGMNVDEVQELRNEGYNSNDFIEKSTHLKRVLDLIEGGFFSQDNPSLFQGIIDSMKQDTFMVCADFDSYYETQQQLSSEYKKPELWQKKAAVNIANMGRFSSDRSIRDYAEKIWKVKI